jgi:hypothetical protein
LANEPLNELKSGLLNRKSIGKFIPLKVANEESVRVRLGVREEVARAHCGIFVGINGDEVHLALKHKPIKFKELD